MGWVTDTLVWSCLSFQSFYTILVNFILSNLIKPAEVVVDGISMPIGIWSSSWDSALRPGERTNKNSKLPEIDRLRQSCHVMPCHAMQSNFRSFPIISNNPIGRNGLTNGHRLQDSSSLSSSLWFPWFPDVDCQMPVISWGLWAPFIRYLFRTGMMGMMGMGVQMHQINSIQQPSPGP